MLCDPGSELRLRGREKRTAKIIKGMEQKKAVYVSNATYSMVDNNIVMMLLLPSKENYI